MTKQIRPKASVLMRIGAINNVPDDRFAKSDLPVVFLDQNWTPEESLEFYVLVPINDVHGRNGKLGTDERTAKNWRDRRAKVGRLAGRLTSLPFQGRFPRNPSTEVPSRDILSHVVFNAIARSFVPWRDELTIDDEHSQRAMTFSATVESGNYNGGHEYGTSLTEQQI